MFLYPTEVSGRTQDDIPLIYREAITAFHNEEFLRAIDLWEEIVRIDPNQQPPHQLIEMARETISSRIAPMTEETRQIVRTGQFRRARSMYLRILSLAPGEPSATNELSRLERTMEILGNEIRGRGDAENIARRGAASHIIENRGEPSLISIIYARQISRNSELREELGKYLDYLYGRYPSAAAEIRVVEGITLLEQYLEAALDSIYDGQYLRSIEMCERALLLEPENTVALMRQGSAYYAMNRPAQAERAWREVLRLEPGNREVRQFLNALQNSR